MESENMRQSTSKNKYRNCKFYAIGKCWNGAQCRFTHSDNTPSSTLQFGTNCKYSHQNSLEDEKDCTICLEPVKSSFGLLVNCDHVFCMDCITTWRKNDGSSMSTEAVRSCPTCRLESIYVIPSDIHLTGQAKTDYVENYIQSKADIHCKRFNYGGGFCPFRHTCFFKHHDRFGNDLKADQKLKWEANQARNGQAINDIPGSIASIRDRQLRQSRNQQADLGITQLMNSRSQQDESRIIQIMNRHLSLSYTSESDMEYLADVLQLRLQMEQHVPYLDELEEFDEYSDFGEEYEEEFGHEDYEHEFYGEEYEDIEHEFYASDGYDENYY